MCNKVETLVITLEEQQQSHELYSESVIYTLLKKKLTIKMLQEYKEYIQKNKKEENVHTPLDWLKEKVKIQTEMQEDLFRIESSYIPRERRNRTHTKETQNAPKRNTNKQSYHCSLCRRQHALKDCVQFLEKTITQRWQIAKDNNLCYRCLGKGHRGSEC